MRMGALDAQEARQILAAWNEEDGNSADLPTSALPELTIDDLPDGAMIQVGSMKEGILHLEWNGTLGRDGNVIYGEADHTWTAHSCVDAVKQSAQRPVGRRLVELLPDGRQSMN
ncbi:MAG: hypothetical protein WB660_16790 [Candidatus Sulfotelmatobacter sp.]